MPWPSNHLPKYRKHKASGQAVVTLNGIEHYLGPHGSKTSKTQYDRLIAEWLRRDRRLQPTDSDSITVVELCARYLRFATTYYRKDGRCTRVTPAIKACIKYLRDWHGRELAADFGPLALKAVRQRMVDDGLSRRYVNDHAARIKRMFKWAVGEQLVPPATYQALAVVSGLLRGRTEARETAPVLPIDDSIVEATLPHLPAVVADMVRLQRFTGMRPAEVCIVRPCDLDRSGDVWLYRPASHKMEHHGRERVVPVGPKAQAVLLRYLARDAEHTASGLATVRRSGALKLMPRGKPSFRAETGPDRIGDAVPHVPQAIDTIPRHIAALFRGPAIEHFRTLRSRPYP